MELYACILLYPFFPSVFVRFILVGSCGLFHERTTTVMLLLMNMQLFSQCCSVIKLCLYELSLKSKLFCNKIYITKLIILAS